MCSGHDMKDTKIRPKLEDGLAKMANDALRGKAQPEKLKKLAEKYKRPANVENLQVPKVEETLWRQLRKVRAHFWQDLLRNNVNDFV